MPKAKLTHRDYLIVRNSKIQGRGVFAARAISKGTRLIEYTGERVSPEEADRRYGVDDTEPHHTYLFGVDEKTVIDATRRGGIAKYINHSCNPNCEAMDEDGRIFIYSGKYIPKGGELTYDYQLEAGTRHTKRVRELYPCNCRAKNCRKTMLRPPRKTTQKPVRSKAA